MEGMTMMGRFLFSSLIGLSLGVCSWHYHLHPVQNSISTRGRRFSMAISDNEFVDFVA